MDPRAKVTLATQEDAAELGRLMRPEDRREVLAMGFTPEFAASHAVRASLAAYAGRVDGELVGVFGVSLVGLMSSTGVPWLLCTPAVDEWPTGSGLESARFHRVLKQRFKRLENFVHAENEPAIRWLRWLGYNIDEPRPFGPYGALFCRFWMEV